jgi:arginine decarboxylase
MPGHFGRPPAGGAGLPWALDWTEVEDLDALSHPTGVLRDLRRRAAAVYGADDAWLSVQGATLPVMAAILGTARPGATMVAERSSHRAVLAAALVGRLHIRWVLPEWDVDWALPLPAPPERWQEALPGARIAVLTAPTYEGVTRPIRPLAESARAAGAALVVDAAHGAHFGRSSELPPHPLTEGAAWVAHGLHKTEPVLTQTGLLLARGHRADPRVDEWWRRLSTSSPSYPLLLSVERYVAEREAGDGGWTLFAEMMRDVWAAAEARGFRVLQHEWARRGWPADPAKLTLFGDGPTLARRLRAWGAEPEMVGTRSITCVAGPRLGLSWDDWQALLDALAPPPPPGPSLGLPAPAPVRLLPWEADAAEWQAVPLAEAVGRIAAYALTPYPPGIPVVMPGEEIQDDTVQWIRAAEAIGVRIEGLAENGDRTGGTVWVVAGPVG